MRSPGTATRSSGCCATGSWAWTLPFHRAPSTRRLARLEEEGLVTHDEVDGRKVYRITEAGREELRSRSDELDELEEELSASVSDIVPEVREDVQQTVRSLREELTWAARESARTGRDVGADAREQARQARRSSIGRAHRPGLLAKKSRSTVSWPILA